MKTNNRFNVLMENNKNYNNNKIAKNNEPKTSTSSFNNFKSNNYKNNRHQDEIDYRLFKEEKMKKQKELDIIKNLDISNFPELKNVQSERSNNNKNITKENDESCFSFADMMKNNSKNANENDNNTNTSEDVETLKPGCVCIKHDTKTNQQIWIYDDNLTKSNSKLCQNNEHCEVYEDPYYVFERLTKVYENRKNDYIKKWGYDEYDKTFLFQNYDYDYFDKLDEKYDNGYDSYYYKANNNYEANDYYDSDFLDN